MTRDKGDFNGWPLDRSPSTQLKYDLLAERFSTGLDSHRKRTLPQTSSSGVSILVMLVIQTAILLSMLIVAAIRFVVIELRK